MSLTETDATVLILIFGGPVVPKKYIALMVHLLNYLEILTEIDVAMQRRCCLVRWTKFITQLGRVVDPCNMLFAS